MQMFYKHWRDVPVAEFKARWPNFSPQEIACKGTGEVKLDHDALDKLQALRVLLGKPLILNSAYRSVKHNTAVGGAKSSQHLLGRAFDVRMDNHDPRKFEQAARSVGFRGIGHYPGSNFMHVDTRKNLARWFGTGANAKWFFQGDPGSATPVSTVTPEFTQPEPEKKSDVVKELAPVVLPGVAGSLTTFAVGEGPVQWAFAATLLVAVLVGVWFLFSKRKTSAEGEPNG